LVKNELLKVGLGGFFVFFNNKNISKYSKNLEKLAKKLH
jgi:hypothetical protein